MYTVLILYLHACVWFLNGFQHYSVCVCTGSRGAKFDLQLYTVCALLDLFMLSWCLALFPRVYAAVINLRVTLGLLRSTVCKRETRDETDLSLRCNKNADFLYAVLYLQSLNNCLTILVNRSIKQTFRRSLFMALKVCFRKMCTVTYWWQKYVMYCCEHHRKLFA